MYREKMLNVSVIENGYILEVHGTYKRKKEEGESKTPCCCPVSVGMGYSEKEVFAKDATDLGLKIEALIPMLEKEFESEEDFDTAFNAAAKK